MRAEVISESCCDCSATSAFPGSPRLAAGIFGLGTKQPVALMEAMEMDPNAALNSAAGSPSPSGRIERWSSLVAHNLINMLPMRLTNSVAVWTRRNTSSSEGTRPMERRPPPATFSNIVPMFTKAQVMEVPPPQPAGPPPTDNVRSGSSVGPPPPPAADASAAFDGLTNEVAVDRDKMIDSSGTSTNASGAVTVNAAKDWKAIRFTKRSYEASSHNKISGLGTFGKIAPPPPPKKVGDMSDSTSMGAVDVNLMPVIGFCPHLREPINFINFLDNKACVGARQGLVDWDAKRKRPQGTEADSDLAVSLEFFHRMGHCSVVKLPDRQDRSIADKDLFIGYAPTVEEERNFRLLMSMGNQWALNLQGL